MRLVIDVPDELAVARIVAALKREDLRLVSNQRNARLGEVLFKLRDDLPRTGKSFELLDFPRGAA